MNEMPDSDSSDLFVVCVNKDGKFLREEQDGQSTWLSWTDNILLADRFCEYFTYGERVIKHNDDPLREPAYYKTWPTIPKDCKMLWCRIRYSTWLSSGKPPFARKLSV